MEARSSCSRWFDFSWLLFWGMASSAWCLTAATQLSATFDETFYLENGMHFWRTGSHDRLMKAGTMPLPVDVQTLPLKVWELFRENPLDTNANFGEMLAVARAGNLVFWWLLLFYGWRLGRMLGGPWAGRLAVALFACEPNLLAHAALATTDISVAACLLALLFHFAVGRERSWRSRIGIPALWYGLALSAKASALLFGPICMIAFDLHRLIHEGRLSRTAGSSWLGHCWRATRDLRRDLYRIIPIGLGVLFILCGCDWKPQSSWVAWAEKLPDGPLRDVMVWLSHNLCIFRNAGEGLMYQIKHNIRGHGVFVFGEWHPRAVAYYFPALLMMKLTIPFLTLVGITLFVRPHWIANPAGLAALALLIFSLNCRVQIGIRLILPLVCFLIIAVSNSLGQLSWVRRPAFLITMLIACALPALRVWPDALRSMNSLGGGIENGYRNVNDSNYDWGQGLHDLAEWQRAHADRPLCVWYFGTDPRVGRPPFMHLRLHQMPLRLPADLEPIVRGKYLAVGTSLLHGNPTMSPAAVQALASLKERTPIGRTRTFFIYEFRNPTESQAEQCATPSATP